MFQGRHWGRGFARVLRNYFVYYLDVDIHNELHNGVLHDIPRPTPQGLAALYRAFKDQKGIIDGMDIVQAAEWLAEACQDEPYHSCMAHQATFLKQQLGE